jgi:glycosyltransferase involved in cell wall biosynthesis
MESSHNYGGVFRPGDESAREHLQILTVWELARMGTSEYLSKRKTMSLDRGVDDAPFVPTKILPDSLMKEKNKIRVLLTVSHFNTTASPYREMIAIAKYLPKDQFDLTICSLRKNGYSEIEPKLRELGVRSIVASFRPRGQSWSYLTHALSSLKDQSLIDSYGPYDIQHSLDYISMPFEAWVARKKSRFFIFNQSNMNELGNLRLLRMKIRWADKIIAISDSIKDLLLTNGAPSDKVKKIYLGIDVKDVDKELLQNPRKRHNYLLSVGRIIRRKRHEDAIKTFSVLAKDYPELRLGIAGSVQDVSYYNELVKLVGGLGLTDRVEFLGVRKDILGLMQNCDALFHCAESEGFGWVVVEAMAVGLPVIASAVDGPKDIIDEGKTGLLVPTGDVSGFANAARSLLDKPEFSRDLAQKARRSVDEKFSANRMVEAISDVYREIVSRP